MSAGSLYVGLDLGNEHHAICVVNDVGKVVFERTVRNDIAALEAITERMADLEASAVRIGVEDKNNPLVDALVAHGLSVFSINPKQVDRFRERASVAGAKDDRRDARVLATTLRSDGECFRSVELGTADNIALRSLNVSIEQVGQELRRSANHLRAQLLRCFPTLLALCGGADEPWFWQLIVEVIVPASGIDECTVAAILKRHRKRKVRVADVVDIATRRRLVPAQGVEEAAHREMTRLVEKLRLAAKHRTELVVERDAVLRRMKGTPEKPSDVDIVMSTPGFGPKTTAIFVANAVPLLKRDGGLAIVRAISGVAPVTKRSGKSHLVEMRRSCDPRVRDALHHAAMAAAHFDPRFREQYQRLRAASHGHARALRGIADRLVGILDAMLRNRTVYRTPTSTCLSS